MPTSIAVFSPSEKLGSWSPTYFIPTQRYPLNVHKYDTRIRGRKRHFQRCQEINWVHIFRVSQISGRHLNTVSAGRKGREGKEWLLFPPILWFDNRKWSLPAKTHCHAKMFSFEQSRMGIQNYVIPQPWRGQVIFSCIWPCNLAQPKLQILLTQPHTH